MRGGWSCEPQLEADEDWSQRSGDGLNMREHKPKTVTFQHSLETRYQHNRILLNSSNEI